jgi:hypothetical protein
MKPRCPHQALLAVVLLSLPALTTACARGGREGADSDQAALHKALSSVAAPKGVVVSSAAAKACAELSRDCPEVASDVEYAEIRGKLKACTAAVALQGNIPAVTVRWRAPSPQPGKPGAEVVATHPSPAILMAACRKDKGLFIMSSDLNPDAVPVKRAKASLTLIPVRDIGKETAVVNLFLRYDGPAAFAENP